MRKLIFLLTFVFSFSSVYGLTNSTLIDFTITGNLEGLEQAEQEMMTAEGETVNTNIVVEMADNIYNNNWIVLLNSSANTLINTRYSYVTNAESQGNNGTWEVGNVLGIRVHFPLQAWNSYALVKPRFELEIYGGEDGNKYSQGKGVIHNVGAIKSVSSWVYGHNYLIDYFINLKNQNGEFIQIPMGNVYFSGWRQLTWNNIDYAEDLRLRDIVKIPLYPSPIPSLKLDSIQFYRSKNTLGGDFITYVKDITIEHDVFIVDEETDIDDEATWHIMRTENERMQAIESARINEELELYEIEKRRMGGDTNDNTTTTTTPTEDEETTTTN